MAERDPNIWKLEDAKARFSELVRRAQADGPQFVTVHGRPAVTITSTHDRPGPTGRTGADLVRLMRQSPLSDVPDELFERQATYSPVRPPVSFDE